MTPDPQPSKAEHVNGNGSGTAPFDICTGCQRSWPSEVLEKSLFICPACAYYLSMPAWTRINSLADPGTFREFDRKLTSSDPLSFSDNKPYWKRLMAARQQTGLREAVVSGKCEIDGRKLALLVFDFRFLGGSMGSVVGEKVTRAFERATDANLPIVTVVATGGARIQEGMLSLLQMAKVSAAVTRHYRSRAPFISVLTNPTFGGVAASFAALGDVLIAEAGANIGFVGPRVIEQTTGIAPPADSHKSENLLNSGLLDCVLPRQEVRSGVARMLAHLADVRRPAHTNKAALRSSTGSHIGAAWEQVEIARNEGRPTPFQFIQAMLTDFVELRGDRESADDRALVGGIGNLESQPVLAIGHNRDQRSTNVAHRQAMASPAGYRKAMRLMRLAGKFRLPVITLIDTPGAESTFLAERHGISHALACSLATMASLPTPIISVVTGQGGSGGALALGVADRILMLEHAVYSVISPEAAASIVYRDAEKATEIAEGLKLTSWDLLKFAVIDGVVPEPEGGAHIDPGHAAAILKQHLLDALVELRRVNPSKMPRLRYAKLRRMGRMGSYWRSIVPFNIEMSIDAFRHELKLGK